MTELKGSVIVNAAVIIPAYNPDGKLKAIVDRVWDLENQIIVVDDGSDMSRSDLFHQLADKAIVIHHEKIWERVQL